MWILKGKVFFLKIIDQEGQVGHGVYLQCWQGNSAVQFYATLTGHQKFGLLR